MWRHSLTAIVALGLMGVGVFYFTHGQAVIGGICVGLAVLRTAAVIWGKKPGQPPEPEIRLNLDDDDKPHRG